MLKLIGNLEEQGFNGFRLICHNRNEVVAVAESHGRTIAYFIPPEGDFSEVSPGPLLTSIQSIMAEKYLNLAHEGVVKTPQRLRIIDDYMRMGRLAEWSRRLLKEMKELEGRA